MGVKTFQAPALPTAIALTVWDLPLSSLTWHYLSLGACKSQCYTAHTDTQSPSLSPALCLTSAPWLLYSFSPYLCMSLCPSASAPPKDAEIHTDTRNTGFLEVSRTCHQSKWSYQSRAQSRIYCVEWWHNRFHPPSCSVRQHIISRSIKLCVRLPLSASHQTLHSFQKTFPRGVSYRAYICLWYTP